METIEIAQLCARYAYDKKAEDILLLDLRGLSPVTDFFVICTATSNPQMRAVRDEIVEKMRDEQQQKPLFHEGGYESQWLIVNYPNVMVHILTPEKREFYSLEELWGDAPKIEFRPEEVVEASQPPVKKKAASKKTATKKVAAKKTAKKAAAKAARKKTGGE